MAKLCTSRTRSGQPCAAFALAGSVYCFMHDPGRAADRADARRRGGLNRRAAHGPDPDSLPVQVRSMDDVMAVLDFTLAETRILENSIARSRCLVALASEFRECLETSELEQRIVALEAANNGKSIAAR